MTIGLWLLASEAAWAICHRAVFTVDDVTVTEGQSAQLTVELEGGAAHCDGTVHYRTTNGSAKSPGDYPHAEGELTFRAGDDRKESFTIKTNNDAVFEPKESFSVVLSQGAAPGQITAWGPPAVVRVNDNDPSPPPSPSPTATATGSPKATPTATPTQTVSPTATATPTPTETATPTEAPTPTPTETDTPFAAPPEESPRGKGGMIAAIAVGVILLGGGIGLALLRRRYGFR